MILLSVRNQQLKRRCVRCPMFIVDSFYLINTQEQHR